ncbi:amino acid adenylation domain-containing protein [Amycolatopsis keratiniphila]|uniref:non-ribosomal peptide synthetase n=1 Tax=Amycolatopsis keratiniphila TaxID=129921 RepID=UPI000879D75B|nr:non-ribosomal peptide synthetase [Amycolatopsis keratiniphila]SDU45146.1 amino acid adenylation domain-containing protein [Amycolatopsis keratiniphila]
MSTSATTSGSALAEIWPLSPMQEGMLYHASLLAEDAPDIQMTQQTQFLDGPLDVRRFRESWEILLDRHAALRAGFHRRKSGEPVQLIFRAAKPPWAEHDLSGLTEADALAEVSAIAEKERARKFDLAKPPLLRLTLIRLGPDRHCLVTTSHHLVMDGWSRAILEADLLDIYAAGRGGPRLRPAGSYGTYLAWLAEQDKEAARAAWRAELAGADGSALGLPERQGADPGPPARELIRHTPDFTAALTEFARGHGLTLNTLVQGAWGIVLARLARRRDVVFGAVVSGRPAEMPGVEQTVGLFIGTVPVRVRLDGDQPIAVLLKDLQERQSALVAHHHLGLPEIQKLGGAGFDTVVGFENYADPAAGAVSPSGLSLTLREYHQAAPYAMTLVVMPGERLTTDLQYQPDQVGAALAEEAHRGLVRVLERMIADPAAPVGRLDVVGEPERELVVERWNDTGDGVPSASVPEMFAAWVRETPGATAVIDGDRVWSFAELDAWAGRVAGALTRRGVRRGDRVGVVMERSAELVAAWLGVWKAGAAFVPVSPDYPPDRVAFMLADSAVAAVACGAETADLVSAGYPALVVDETVEGEVPPFSAGADDPAYVIYTSGSTGTPKGVVVQHRAAAILVGDPGWAVGPGDTVLMHAPHTFDASVFDLWVSLGSGAAVLLAEPGMVDAARLVASVAKGVTAVVMMAGQFRALAQESPEVFSGLRELLLSGDVVPPEMVDRVRRACPRLRVWHAYGPTEAAVCVSSKAIEPGDGLAPVLPIGGPLPGRRLYVLDVFLRPVPPGFAGDLYIGGDAVAQGYLGRTALTSERFVADPFAGGRRMYRTGDVAYWTDEGELVFAGRADDQVKIRGFRVEPGEIEAALSAQAGVDQAVVVARDGRLIGYVVSGGAVDPGPLRERLATILPDHLVPAAIVVLDALPVTANGKVDRAMLPDPDFRGLSAGREPSTEMERALCALFAEVLGLTRIGADDSFFELGGDSLLSMQLAARAHRDGMTFGAREVFEYRTPSGIAAFIGRGTASAAVGAQADVALLDIGRDEMDEFEAEFDAG